MRIEGKTVSVRMTGVTIIRAAQLKGITDGELRKGDSSTGPIVLQSHAVTGAKFRNITITPL